MLGGWASNNKYALIGGMRSAAQMLSFEIPIGMSVVGVVLMSGSINLNDIVLAQAHSGWWNIVPQILAAIVFFVASTGELNRTPFDLPEAESELVGGYHTEYSGFRFAFFMLTEYVYLFAMAGRLPPCSSGVGADRSSQAGCGLPLKHSSSSAFSSGFKLRSLV
jgi:NADH-quinone oxidoreductase subunit H